jgi:hypothetical protein
MDFHADQIRRPLDSKRIAPSLFAHFVLRTANKKALVDWYCAVLAAHPVFENDYISFVTYDAEHHRVAFVQMPGVSRTSPTPSPSSASFCRPTAG